MKKDEITLISRYTEEVYLYGEKMNRTVWWNPSDKKYYIKIDGEFIEVYRRGSGFSTYPDGINFVQYGQRYGYTAMVYDRPSRSWINLCEYNKDAGKWQDCLFNSIDEAVAAQKDYNDTWRDHYGF